jgi:hypothetical protein
VPLVLARFLRQDGVLRVGRPDGGEDRLLREVVRLGDDVAGGLVVDPLQALVGSMRSRPPTRPATAEGELGGNAPPPRPGDASPPRRRIRGYPPSPDWLTGRGT